MQEYERLFPQEDEEGVAELGDFGQHEQRCPKARYSVVGYETESVLATLRKELINQNITSGKEHREADAYKVKVRTMHAYAAFSRRSENKCHPVALKLYNI